MVRRRSTLILACLAALAGAPLPTLAASPPPAVAEVDPLKATFEAFADADRRALQDALVWTGDFTGAVAGSYGPRTHDALLAHAKRTGVSPSAALDAPARTALLVEAEAARRAVGFAILRDPRAGLALGLPLKLLPSRSTLPAGTRYAAADGGAVVETSGQVTGPDGLVEVFARLTRDAPGRRVTYRLAKPDFVVVTGEEGPRKFYSRSALGAAPGGGSVVRGFTLSYAKSAPDMDRIALALAASFDPFPAAAAPVPQIQPQPAPPPPVTVLAGEAVLVGPDLALTRADAARCDGVEVGGAPARWQRRDASTGLALLAVPGHAGAKPVALSTLDDADRPEAARLALFLVPAEARDSPTVLSAAGVSTDGSGRVRAPLQGGDSGVVLIDAVGALSGLTAGRGEAGMRVDGIVAEDRYEVSGVAQVAAFLRDAAVPTAPAGTGVVAPGEAAARWRPAILPLRCRVMPVAPATP